MKTLYPIFMIAIGLAQGRAEASPSPTNGVVITSDLIAQLMSEGQTNNPGQLAANSRAKAASANVDSIRIWDDPIFTFGGGVFSSRGFDPGQNGDLTYGISEGLPLWGKPGLNRQMARAEMFTSQAQESFQFQELRRDLTKALFAAALDQQVVNIDEQDLVWLKATATAVDAKYRAGQADAGDSLEIQNEAAVSADQLRTDQLDLSHDQFVLNRLLNRKPESPWPPLHLPPIAPPVPYSAKLLSLAMNNEPQLKVKERQIEQAKASAELAHRSRLPDVSLGVQGYQFHGDGGFRSGFFTLSFPLPWGNSGKYAKDYERELKNEKAAEEDRDDQMLTVHEQVHHMTIDLDAARRQALLYQNEISIRAEEVLSDKLAGWETGRVILRDVLDARRDALDAQLIAARATTEQYQTLAELVLWTGQQNFESLTSLTNEAPVQSVEK